MGTELFTAELSQPQFIRISRLLYALCGIRLSEGKEGLVKARLMKRLRTLGLKSFDAYIRLIEQDPLSEELTIMLDCLTTNKTSFFREIQHFEYLREKILPPIREARGRLRIWSAGCSSGEEPYSIAILLKEEWPGIDSCDARILATDLSTRILEQARAGVYSGETLQNVPLRILTKYFTRSGDLGSQEYHVTDQVRLLVRIARLNLMEEWPMKGPFDVIFCRNVMIYFDKPTQKALVKRFWNLLRPGGHLFIGHSESLMASSQEFRYVQPATYRK